MNREASGKGQPPQERQSNPQKPLADVQTPPLHEGFPSHHDDRLAPGRSCVQSRGGEAAILGHGLGQVNDSA